jgi:hypothetical protein
MATEERNEETRMKKLALLLSLLALGALGLVACGGGDDEDTTAAASPDTTAEARFCAWSARARAKCRFTTEGKLSRKQVQELKRAANDWASLFATNACNRYMGQPICERLFNCENYVGEFIENCTPVSRAFRKSFAGATVEDIKFKGIEVLPVAPAWAGGPLRFYLATVKFSNGEVVVFSGLGPGAPEPPDGSCAGPGSGCAWNIWSGPGQNRRFVRAATTPP